MMITLIISSSYGLPLAKTNVNITTNDNNDNDDNEKIVHVTLVIYVRKYQP